MNNFICEYCGAEFFNKKSYNAHVWQCKQNPNYKKKEINVNGFNKLNEERDDLFCKYCNRKSKNLNSLYAHERQCKFNPNRTINIPNNTITTNLQKYNEKLKNGEIKSWNKGLTKETDERVKKNGETISKKIKSGEIMPSFLGKRHSKETIEKLRKSGGYRKGCGRGKKGIYKGYYCDSSWELAFVIYNIEHDIEFKRNTQLFEYEFGGEIHKYMPDFIIDDVYYEIKGYWTEQWQAKYDSFKKGHKIKVIDKKKIKTYLEYVIQKYGKDYIKLYEKWEGSSNGRAEA